MVNLDSLTSAPFVFVTADIVLVGWTYSHYVAVKRAISSVERRHWRLLWYITVVVACASMVTTFAFVSDAFSLVGIGTLVKAVIIIANPAVFVVLLAFLINHSRSCRW